MASVGHQPIVFVLDAEIALRRDVLAASGAQQARLALDPVVISQSITVVNPLAGFGPAADDMGRRLEAEGGARDVPAGV